MNHVIELCGIPVTWKSHAGFGRKSFNPRYAEKQQYQYMIRQQYKESPMTGPVVICCKYYFPVPKSTSKIRKEQMLSGYMHHLKRPDIDNLNKFLNDCLKTIIFDDDSQIWAMYSEKLFSEVPRTTIVVSGSI